MLPKQVVIVHIPFILVVVRAGPAYFILLLAKSVPTVVVVVEVLNTGTLSQKAVVVALE
jgi:hypothetical protein